MRYRFVLSIVSLTVLLLACAGFLTWRFVHRGFSTRNQPGKIEAMLATTFRQAAIPSGEMELKNPMQATPDVLREGMAHWADHCASCHGNNGSSETMYGKTMYPRPPDMRRAPTQELSDGELYYTIKNGVRLSGMPAFGEPGDDDIDSWKLVAFIRHLPKLTEQEELQMEQLNPKTSEELQEEREEQQFLNGGGASASPETSTTHR
ncbi:cytochrome C [Terriglobus albidus]|uniref:Cytochrome C n=1 Tax=Terriglobus albidus TaxID=1592106 RepID=A0A5B9ED00_9BACT|nr:c-type cytochrome [Terriglobus albidus]QEE30043.1 cytochrome C [Terriglobus albidus]